MRTYARLLPFLLLLVDCGTVDKVLEGHSAPNAHISLALSPATVTVVQGTDQPLTITVTRTGDYSGPVSLGAEGLPSGVTADLSNSPPGTITTVSLTLHVAADAPLGAYLPVLRGKANELTDATTPLNLVIVPPPAFAMTLAAPSMTVSRGGSAPMLVAFARTNLTTPVALTLDAPAGITGTFTDNPAAGDGAALSVAVASTVSAGTYSLTVRGTAGALAPRTATLSVTVTNDPFQPVVAPRVAILQGASITQDVTINRATYSGPVTLAGVSLPAGVTMSFQPDPSSGNTASMTVTAAPSVVPGAYPLTIRGTGTGGESVTSTFQLDVAASTVVLSASPSPANVLRSAGVVIAVSLARTSLTGPVVLTAEGLPAGVTATFDGGALTGNSSNLTLTASASAALGTSTVTIRGTPQGWASGASPTTTVSLTVLAALNEPGDVTLDWTGCAQPLWVGAQNGSVAWTQVTGVNGIYHFVINGKAAFAWVDEGPAVTVRYLTRAELTAAPFRMCPATAGTTKRYTATAAHTISNETASYALGGGTGQSSFGNNNVIIAGVRDGTHDLIAWGSINGAVRGILRRNVNLPDNSSLGVLDLNGPESFVPVVGNVTSTLAVQGEGLTSEMSYLTTPACEVNSFATAANAVSMFGVPVNLQLDSDQHMFTLIGSSSAQRRSATLSFHVMSNRSVSLPTVVVASVSQPAGSYKLLSASYGTVAPDYNGATTLRMIGGQKSFTVIASRDFSGQSGYSVTIPDLVAAPGWSNAWAIASDVTGTYSLTLEGASSPNLCVEGRRAVSLVRTGTF